MCSAPDKSRLISLHVAYLDGVWTAVLERKMYVDRCRNLWKRSCQVLAEGWVTCVQNEIPCTYSREPLLGIRKQMNILEDICY